MFAGVATGKTYTGSHFAIKMIQEHPDKTGLVGANSYDQMTQATLRELLYWLDFYNMDFVIDRRPPEGWGLRKQFKRYGNILTVRTAMGAATIFTRTLSKPNSLRGIEISWYWIDETRDTPSNTHDILLSRMRETPLRKGLITTTTNGEDWAYKRFVQRKGIKNQLLYGSMHVKTSDSVKQGIITQDYYDLMRSSYSPMMAAQELDALHVNANSGLAYYAASDRNKRRIAPWGDANPNPDRPLIIGCDFNYQPAPCVWMVGQLGPNLYNDKGELWSDYIHWFDEISGVQMSTPDMARRVGSKYMDFTFEVFGDASGGIGTTSNAGDHDYNQMAETFADMGIVFTIDKELGYYNPEDLKRNPLVKMRVEQMNMMFLDGVGRHRMSYNPDTCPLFDSDLRIVGWKTNHRGKGRLDSGGDVQRTHATDGAGYAIFKKFPPTRRATIIDSVESYASTQLKGIF